MVNATNGIGRRGVGENEFDVRVIVEWKSTVGSVSAGSTPVRIGPSYVPHACAKLERYDNQLPLNSSIDAMIAIILTMLDNSFSSVS